jgi:hypothetical protein
MITESTLQRTTLEKLVILVLVNKYATLYATIGDFYSAYKNPVLGTVTIRVKLAHTVNLKTKYYPPIYIYSSKIILTFPEFQLSFTHIF